MAERGVSAATCLRSPPGAVFGCVVQSSTMGSKQPSLCLISTLLPASQVHHICQIKRPLSSFQICQQRLHILFFERCTKLSTHLMMPRWRSSIFLTTCSIPAVSCRHVWSHRASREYWRCCSNSCGAPGAIFSKDKSQTLNGFGESRITW